MEGLQSTSEDGIDLAAGRGGEAGTLFTELIGLIRLYRCDARTLLSRCAVAVLTRTMKSMTSVPTVPFR